MRATAALPRSTFALRLVACGLVAAAGLGCQRTGTVAGRITFQGKAVVYGTVLVVARDGHLHQGAIREDGSYSVPGVGVGEARLAVNSPDPTTPLVTKPGQLGGADPAEGRRRAGLKARWFPLPGDYGDPDKSGLKVEVKAGDNAHDIALE